jgi:hypothetical protein
MSGSGKRLVGKALAAIDRLRISHILLLAFVLRILFYAVVYENFADRYGWKSDDNYDEIAKNVIAGNGYRINDAEPPSTVRPPLYTVFLILIFSTLGEERWKVVVMQALLQALVCGILYRIGRRTTNSTAAAKAAAFIFAVYPQSMLYSSMLLTESLFAFLTVLSASLYLDFIEKEDAKSAVLLGVVLGMAALTRPVSLLLLVPLLAWYVFGGGRTALKRRLRNTAIAASVFILALVPWTVRNYLLTDKIIPVASRGGHFFYSNTISGREEELSDQMREFGEANNNEPDKRDEAYISLALRNIAEKPHLFLRNTLMSMLDFWYRGHSRSISIFNAVVNFTLLSLAVLGVLHYRKFHGALLVPFLIFILYYNVCYGLLHAIARYSFPVIAFVMLYASFYLWHESARNRHAGL